jgi:hypothetical protein
MRKRRIWGAQQAGCMKIVEINTDIGQHYNSVWIHVQPILFSALCVHTQ